MNDLRVDFAALDAMQRSLREVAKRFEALGDRSGTEARIWGGSRVRSEMEQFADNWKSHRQKLTEDAQKLAEGCAATAETFRAVDAGLAGAPHGEVHG